MFTWGGGASQPGNSGILRYDLATGAATTRFYSTVPEGREDELWGCTESEQLWPEPADPETRRVAFAPCRSRVDAVEAREQAARDLLAAAGVLVDIELRRPGERRLLACDGCASLGDLEFRELLAASGVAVERARSSPFEAVRVEHRGFSVYDSFSAVFTRCLPDGAWQALYGQTYRHNGYGVERVSFRPREDASLELSMICENDAVLSGFRQRCDAVVDLNDRSLRVIGYR